MSLILMTTLFYKALILLGEIWCWSVLGFKGLKLSVLLYPSRLALLFAGREQFCNFSVKNTEINLKLKTWTLFKNVLFYTGRKSQNKSHEKWPV